MHSSSLRYLPSILHFVVRTFPYHRLFMDEATEAKRSLLHILMLYSTQYNKIVGYCQGMYMCVCVCVFENWKRRGMRWALSADHQTN